MDKNEQIQEWKRQLEQASEYGLFFDKATVREMVEMLENQQKEIKHWQDIAESCECNNA